MKRLSSYALMTLIIALALLFPWTAYAANPAPVQTFYVTLPEADALTVLSGINAAAVSPVTTYFSVAIGVGGTRVYYDQWENGYDSDIANPTNVYSAGNPGGTQIWGNSLAADGCAPNKNGVAVTCTDGNDTFSAGDVIIPSSSIPIPRVSSNIFFDARDKVGASSSIAMARASWAAGSGTLNAFAHEMYATAEWGTAYESPVGTTTAYPAQGYTGQGMFEYAALSIMATQNNTTVQIDKDANGSYETNVTLQEGGTTLVTPVSQGARVQTTDAAKPIQVVLVTGDIGSNYESRDMNLLPVSAYGSSYWSPVGNNTGLNYTPGPTRLFLYSPSTGGPAYITCVRRAPTPTTVTQAVIARGVVYVDLNDNSGAHCYAASDSSGTPAPTTKIFGIGTVDTAVQNVSAGQAGDWSFTLYPDGFLSTDALVGLGLGRDPTATGAEDGSPLWVTPMCDTYVYVDWNNDGTPDQVDFSGNGDVLETNVDGLNETNSNGGFLVTALKSVRLYKPSSGRNDPYDQSGARVWSRTASGVGRGGSPGCNLALAWGQDPRRASAAAPGLDVGTSVPPLRLIEGTKSLALKTDADGDGVLSPGDIATYNITIKNTGSGALNNVYVYDAGVPATTTYNTTTTQKDVGSGWTSIPDDGSGTAFPLDVTGTTNGVLLGTSLPANTTWYVRFDVTLKNIDVAGVYEELSNCDIAYTGGGTVQSCTTNLVASNDWGDLPDTYGTSLAANGPRHSLSTSALKLGAYIDRDLQGQPSTGADGDDLTRTPDDEDGIVITGNQGWQTGAGTVQVTVANGPGCLNAWMDFTNDSGATPPSPDGNFTKTAGGYDTATVNATAYSEYFIQNVKVNSGTTNLTVSAPPGVFSGASGVYFRFRLSPTDGSGNCTAAIAPTGYVAGGEVEDYYITPVDLAVTKTDGLTTVKSAQVFAYTLSVSNAGPGTATGVVLADTIGTNLTYQSSTCGTPTVNGSTYTWNLANLAAGANTSCTVTVKAANGLTDGTQLTNYARVSATALEVNVTNNEASDIDTVLGDKFPDLQVTKSDGATQVLAGSTLVYTINYSNVGQAKATGVTVTDVLPTNVTYVSASPAPTTINGSTYTWNVADVNVNGSGSIQVTVRVNVDQLAGTVVLNRVSITENETDTNPADNSTADSDTVIAPYVVIEKTAAGLDPVSGQVTYSIYWYNNSTATAANVQIQDTLPAGTTFVSASGGVTPVGGVLTWNLGNQAPGASGTVSFKVTVNSGAGGALQTSPTLSTETGTGGVTVTSKTTQYSSLPWCDSAYSIKCLTYRGLYQAANGVGPTGWADNPRATVFVDTSWTQPIAPTEPETYWLDPSVLSAQWTTANTDRQANPNYTFFRQAFCLPLNAGNLGAGLKLSSDDTSTIYLNGINLGQHTGGGGYSTLAAGGGIQSGINILAVQLLNNTHGGHAAYGNTDHIGLLFNLQASYGSLRPFASAPTMTVQGQNVTISVDQNALGGRTPYSYKFDFGDGTVVDYQSLTSQSHTYSTPGTYVATVTARAQYGCTATDQVTITVLPDGSNLLANTASVAYQSTSGTNYSGQSGAGIKLAGAIGDTVWLDENGNGVQDAGEAGIANVTVELWNAGHTTKIATTVTDANGNYVFTNVPVGTYQVDVVSSSLPAGLAANPTYEEDHTLDNTTSVTLTPGVEHMTADFGYNWAPSSDVTGNTGTGAIGDRVWIDADGDGVQDANEAGLGGVTVRLLTDSNGDGIYGGTGDTPAVTTTTDAAGNYIFDGLAAGAYVVEVAPPAGYAQKGDPDQPGITCTTCDNKTTIPIVLAPGDVYVNADFGYQLTSGANIIGDQIFLDANGDGNLDAGEPGIAGVTVALLNSDGKVIATTTTDANGAYSFPGLPDGTYTVWVNDTANVLGTSTQSSTPNNAYDGGQPCGTCTGRNSVTVSGGTSSTFQDFGYAPAGQTTGKGLIGDTIFLDRNGDRSYDAGEGLEGVTVRLYADGNSNGTYDAGERLLAQTTTDENGNYYFANLPAGNYVVVVDTTTLPGGVTNTVDPNQDTVLNDTGVTLAAGGISLLQDFGYQGTNSVSGTIWTDANTNGAMDSAETSRLAGVTVALYDSHGNIVATTTTDASGNYSFTNLPNGTYTVDVTDQNNVLDGYWHSLGTPNTDGYSQSDPYTVTVSGGQTNSTADFGYYITPAALGNRVWIDTNGNGIQDSGEPGMAGVEVVLTITYPNGAGTTTIKTITDANGWYSFGNLLQDEDFGDGVGSEPVYTISLPLDGNNSTVLANYAGTIVDQTVGCTNCDLVDADPYGGVTASPSKGQAAVTSGEDGTVPASYDFGFYYVGPTAVVLSRFDAQVQNGQVVVEWETASERNTAGFFVYRQDPGSGPLAQVNQGIVPALLGTTGGGTYRLLDPGAQPGGTFAYFLQEIEAGGHSHRYGPFVVRVEQGAAAARAFPLDAGVPYGRTVHPATLEKQPAQPEPNKGTDVPKNLPGAPAKPEPIGRPEIVPSPAVQLDDAGQPVVEPTQGDANIEPAPDAVQDDAIVEPAPDAKQDDSIVEPAPNVELEDGTVDPAPFVETAAATSLAKLTVRRAGLYYLAASDIAPALGLTAAQVMSLIKDTGLKLTNQGETVSYLPASSNAGIYFYAEGLDSPYAIDNVYWLQQAAGKRIAMLGGKAPAAVALATFPASSHAEQDLLPLPSWFNDPAADYWMWAPVVAGDPLAGSRSFGVQADGAAAQGAASVTARFRGLTASGTGADHHAQIKLNGTLIGDAIWTGTEPYEVTLPVNPALLAVGANTVEVAGRLDAGVPYSIFCVDSFDLSYPRYYSALNDVLPFPSLNNQALTVYGFSNSNVLVFDISNPKQPKRVTAMRVEASGGAYRVTFKPAAANGPFLATTTLAVPRITTLAADAPSALKGPNGANYLIVTAARLAGPAQTLAAYRQEQGLQAKVVDVQDVYDEFDGGVASPQALKDFLAYAYANWSPAPKYVLLAGAGSYDYKNNLGYDDSLVPPILVGTLEGLSAADNRYGDMVGNDGTPEIAVGRLPALDAPELDAVIAKIRAYEAADPAVWSKQALMLADNTDPDAGDFPADSDALAALLPAGYTAQKVYLGPLTAAQARSQTLAALGAGAGVFNYVGHAGLTNLAEEELLTNDDVPGLRNSPRLPFMSAATCAVGDYVEPGYRTLGVVLALQGDGGAAAVFSPTGLSYNADGVTLDGKLFQELFGGASTRAGDATRAALAQYAAHGGERYALDTYNLLGDPAMVMRWR